MKTLFQKYWWTFIILAIGVVLFFCGALNSILTSVGTIIVGLTLCFFAYLSYKKYRSDTKKEETREDIFDARKYGYDEEVYYLEEDNMPKKKFKGLTKADSLFTLVSLCILAIILLSFGIISLIKTT